MATISEMIERHNELKAYLEKSAESFAAHVKPYNEAMGVIEQAILTMLNKEFPDLNGPASFKCEAGTAYRSNVLSVSVTDKKAYLDFLLEPIMQLLSDVAPTIGDADWYRDALAKRLEFLDARVLKEPVKQWRESNHVDPPGVTGTPAIKCNIRRT